MGVRNSIFYIDSTFQKIFEKKKSKSKNHRFILWNSTKNINKKLNFVCTFPAPKAPQSLSSPIREIQFLHWTSKWPKKTLFWKVNITSHGSVSFKSKLRCDSGRICLDFDCKQNFIKVIFRNHRFFNKNHNFKPKRTTVWESLQTGGAWTANEILSKLPL